MISVCLTSFNGVPYIKPQIVSVLDSFIYAGIEDYEILVSDDGSSDHTKKEILAFSDHRIQLFDGPQAGVIKNFEFILEKASGDIIFLADQDDIWKKEKVKECLNALKTADLVVTDAMVVDKNLSVLHRSFFNLRSSGSGIYKNLWKNTYLGCCMCFKRQTFTDINCLPFPENIPMHDWWIGLMFERYATVKFVNKPLLLYRRHGGNVSETAQQSTSSLLKKLKWRFNLIYQMLIR